MDNRKMQNRMSPRFDDAAIAATATAAAGASSPEVSKGRRKQPMTDEEQEKNPRFEGAAEAAAATGAAARESSLGNFLKGENCR